MSAADGRRVRRVRGHGERTVDAVLRLALARAVATSYAAEGAAVDANRRGEASDAARMREVAGAVRGNVRVLRSLLVDIYPESLGAAGVASALRDLAATARTRGARVTLELRTPLDHLPEAHERLLYRVAQEALRNAVAHAAPCAVTVTVTRVGAATELRVEDDGPGFGPAILQQPPIDGHLGTRVLRDLATDAGAELALSTAPGRGTRWRLRLPLYDNTRESA